MKVASHLYLSCPRMVVVLKNKIYLYTLDRRPRQLQVIETIENPMGIAAISSDQDNDHFWLAYPGLQVGQICLMRITAAGDTGASSLVIAAHKSPVAALALNRSGTLLASASEKGTLVRIHEVRSGRLRYELRRGADRALIYDIVFNGDSSLVAVSSDKGTVHIFSLPEVGAGADCAASTLDPSSLALSNRQSSLAFMKEMLPKYFASQWSFAQCRVGECRSAICFGADPSTIYVITVDGHFYRFRFDLLGGRTGECIKEFQSKFISVFYE